MTVSTFDRTYDAASKKEPYPGAMDQILDPEFWSDG